MAGKSIDEILRQQAAQRQAQIQQQQAQERALNEQRERQRQEHLQRMRMFEKLSSLSPAAAAASSAGGKSQNSGWIDSALSFMNSRYSEVTNLVPDLYSFWDDYTTSDEDDSPILTGINDGGDDMYDGANYMNTNLTQNWDDIKEGQVDDDGPLAQASIPYTHTQADNEDDDPNQYYNPPMDGSVKPGDSYFGSGSKYFTNMYPGLFLMISDKISISEFNISGNLGSDGDGAGAGSVDSVIPGWSLFYKTNTDLDNEDPSINQLILVPGSSTGITHEYDTSSEDDDHRITGIDDRSRIVYAVVARHPDKGVLSRKDAILIAQKILEIILNTEPVPPTPAPETINGHAELILFKTSDFDNWQYVILDYLSETISEIKDTDIDRSVGYNLSMVENSGWVIEFNDDILFINDNAEIVKSVDKSINGLYTSRNVRNTYIAYMNDGTVYHFNGKVVNTYTELPESSIIDSLQITKNGTLAIVTIVGDDVTTYAWNPTIGLVTVWSGNYTGNRYNGLVAYGNSEIFMVTEFNDATDGWSRINVFGEDGTTKSSLDVSALENNLNQGYDSYLGDSNVEYQFTRGTSASTAWYFNTYDADSNVWRSTTHAKGTNYPQNDRYYQDRYDGSQFTSLSNGILHLLHDGVSTNQYNIDLYGHLDVVWSIDGGTYSSYTVNNSGTPDKGIDVNDADRDGFSNGSLYLGKSIFLPMWLNDSKISLLCLTSTQSVVISAATTTNLTGNQGYTLIPGWNDGQKYASFRVGDNFGIWLAYASNDVYKIYNEFGANVISLTMSVNTRLNYTGDLAVVTDDNAGIEYVFTSNTLGLSPSYATYSTLGGISHYGLKPTYTDGDKTPSLMLNLNEGGLSRIFTDEDVHEFTLPELTWNRWLSDEYIVLEGRDGPNYNLYFYNWSGTLLDTVDTGIVSGTSYDANLVKDRVFFKVVNGSTTTYYYFSPTKSDSVSIENESSSDVNYDYWTWWNN